MSVAKLIIEVSAIDSASRVMAGTIRHILGSLGSLQGPIGNVSKAWKTFLNSFGNLTPTQQKFAIAGAAMTAIGAGIIVFLGDCTKKAIGYEYAMAKLNRVLDLSPAKLQQLGNDIMVISGQTQYTAQQLVDAATLIAQHGITNTDTIKTVLLNAADVAQATGSDLNTVANDMGGMMNMFPGMANNVSGAANTITASIDSGMGSIGNLNTAMQQVGPYAQSLGYNFHDVSAALTTMVKNGANASSAGTGLYQMLAHLNPQTKAAKEWFQKLGLAQLDVHGNVIAGTNAFYDQHGKIKPLATIVDILRSKYKGLSDSQLQQAASAMFTVRSSKTMNQLLESGSTSLENVTKAMDNQATAQHKANQINDTTQGQLTILGTNWTNLQVTLGETFLPIVNKLVVILNKVLDWFLNLPGPAKTVIAIVMAVVGVLLLIAGPILMLVSLFSIIGPLLEAVGAAFTFVAGPILLVVVAVIAVIAIVVLLVTHWKQVTTWLHHAWGVVWKAILGIVDFVLHKTIIGWIILFVVFVVKHWSQISKFVGNLFHEIGTKIHDFIVGAIKFVLNLALRWYKMNEDIKAHVITFITNIVGFFLGLPDKAAKGFDTLFSKAKTFISNLLGIFKPVTDLLGKIGGVLSNPGKALGGLLSHFPHLASGGIVSSPTTALIGEAGPEAVIPLSQMSQLFSGGGETHIHLYLDGKQLAKSVDYHIAKQFRKNQGERAWGTR